LPDSFFFSPTVPFFGYLSGKLHFFHSSFLAVKLPPFPPKTVSPLEVFPHSIASSHKRWAFRGLQPSPPYYAILLFSSLLKNVSSFIVLIPAVTLPQPPLPFTFRSFSIFLLLPHPPSFSFEVFPRPPFLPIQYPNSVFLPSTHIGPSS